MSDVRSSSSREGLPRRREADWDETWEDVAHEAPAGARRAGFGTDLGRARRPVSRRRRWTTLLLALALMVPGLIITANALSPLLGGFSPVGVGGSKDYEGTGEGSVRVTIPEGASGRQIGTVLEENGVIASASKFAEIIALEPQAGKIQPGVYEMRQKMSTTSALEMLLDPSSLKVDRVTIREGLWVNEVFAALSKATGEPVAEYTKVQPASLPLPSSATGLEGYLYPATYGFSPDATAREQLTKMVETGNEVRERLGVDEKDANRIMTVASIAQAEGGPEYNFGKVASVIENRLDDKMKLGMDSTIHFILQERGKAGTSDAAREDTSSPYNTYAHEGLPPGPINSPGEAAIQAALKPAKTDFLYFVTVNPSTGETRFAKTYAEHLENKRIFDSWCADNRDQC